MSNVVKVPIIFTQEQRDLIERAALKIGMKFSTYVRSRAIDSAYGDLENVKKRI